MTKQFDLLAEEMLEDALKDFRQTEVYKFQKEQLAQMDKDCETMFTQAEQAFAEECFNLILDTEEVQTQYAYRRGLTDSVQLLKWLGVLA